MKFFDGQVHLVEVILLTIYTLLGFAIGYSLPLVAGLALLFLPLLLFQLAFDWIGNKLGKATRKWWRKGKPERPPRHGVARYIWFGPLIAVATGYAMFVIETGKFI